MTEDPDQAVLFVGGIPTEWRAAAAAEPCVLLEAVDAAAVWAVLGARPIATVVVQAEAEQDLDLCRRLAARVEAPLVLVVTSAARARDVLAAGASDVIVAPVDPALLWLRVHVLLRAHERARLRQRRRDHLFALVIHDLRNPLGGLLGYLSLLSEGTEDPAQLEDLAAATEAATRLRGGIDDVLDTVRLAEACNAEPECERQPTQLAELVGDVLQVLQGSAEQRGVTLRAQLEPLPPIAVDARLLRRAVENLVAGALRSSRRGGAVEVALRTDDRAIRVEVADRAKTIPDEVKARLFDRFCAIDLEGLEPRRGNGFGFHFVRLIAEAHGGHAAVADRPDGGNVFSITLPRAPS